MLSLSMSAFGGKADIRGVRSLMSANDPKRTSQLAEEASSQAGCGVHWPGFASGPSTPDL